MISAELYDQDAASLQIKVIKHVSSYNYQLLTANCSPCHNITQGSRDNCCYGGWDASRPLCLTAILHLYCILCSSEVTLSRQCNWASGHHFVLSWLVDIVRPLRWSHDEALCLLISGHKGPKVSLFTSIMCLFFSWQSRHRQIQGSFCWWILETENSSVRLGFSWERKKQKRKRK